MSTSNTQINPKDLLSNHDVSVFYDGSFAYSDEPPYSPDTKFPEYCLSHVSETPNPVYQAVRKALSLLKLDIDNFSTPLWNPLKRIITPGNVVVVKPNFVISQHDEGGDIYSIITHPGVIRAAVDYAYIALEGRGRIIIADAPQMDCNFSELLRVTQLESIRTLYKRESDFNIEIYDLRNFWLDRRRDLGAAYAGSRHALPGDPSGGVLVSLGKKSLFHNVKEAERFYGADYDRAQTKCHHHGETQEYMISKTILSADAVILLPKLKVHKKVGVTLNIKGLVGTSVDKNYLIHYRLGSPSTGGDQYPDNLFTAREDLRIKLQRWAYDKFLAKNNAVGDSLYKCARGIGRLALKPFGVKLNEKKSVMDGGNWYGNDSTWRMAIDLLLIFFYADANGSLWYRPVRRVFSMVDGIVGGESNGPLVPVRKPAGLLVAGTNPCAVDLACTRLMGYDPLKLKMFSYLLNHPNLFFTTLGSITVSSNRDFGKLFHPENKDCYFAFAPHPGWQGHIEIE